MAARLAVVALLIFVAGGCKRSSKPSDGPCTVSLHEHCKAGGCESLRARAAALRSEVARHVATGSCLARAAIGTCGRYRYVESSDGYHGRIDYFQATGEHVGAEVWSDIGYCDGTSTRATAGDVPQCARVATETLCPRPAEAGSSVPPVRQ